MKQKNQKLSFWQKAAIAGTLAVAFFTGSSAKADTSTTGTTDGAPTANKVETGQKPLSARKILMLKRGVNVSAVKISKDMNISEDEAKIKILEYLIKQAKEDPSKANRLPTLEGMQEDLEKKTNAEEMANAVKKIKAKGKTKVENNDEPDPEEDDNEPKGEHLTASEIIEEARTLINGESLNEITTILKSAKAEYAKANVSDDTHKKLNKEMKKLLEEFEKAPKEILNELAKAEKDLEKGNLQGAAIKIAQAISPYQGKTVVLGFGITSVGGDELGEFGKNIAKRLNKISEIMNQSSLDELGNGNANLYEAMIETSTFLKSLASVYTDNTDKTGPIHENYNAFTKAIINFINETKEKPFCKKTKRAAPWNIGK